MAPNDERNEGEVAVSCKKSQSGSGELKNGDEGSSAAESTGAMLLWAVLLPLMLYLIFSVGNLLGAHLSIYYELENSTGDLHTYPSKISLSESTSHSARSKVAIIGCGPSGMFFLHAVAQRRKQFEEEGNLEALARLPDVTCFEKSSSPGGLWRSNRNDIDGDESVNMYEALWTNSAKEAFEFYDYTFDEHFGGAVSTYLPRERILDYMLARVTKSNPTFFDNITFNTSVEWVEYNEETSQFLVETLNHETGTTYESYFDKCIWAAGTNGRPRIPKSVSKALKSGEFNAFHSSEVGSNYDELVRGKKILFIGDSFSAEDLTLQALKLGVDEVHICSGSGKGVASLTQSWPRNRVRIYKCSKAITVINDGWGVVLSDNDKKGIVIGHIDTVVYCTGYKVNYGMLDDSLRPNKYHLSDYDIPEDWQMAKNDFSDEFGEISIGELYENQDSSVIETDMYRGHLVQNPSMMFLVERLAQPLLDLDVSASLMLSHIIGDIPLPTADEMDQYNLDTLLNGMQEPLYRIWEDANYHERLETLHGSYDDWFKDLPHSKRKKLEEGYVDLQYRILARDMLDANYPLQIGSFNQLNEKGKALVKLNLISQYHRYKIDVEGNTFRDGDPSECQSIFTGTQAAPLKTRWLDLDDDLVEVHMSGHKIENPIRNLQTCSPTALDYHEPSTKPLALSTEDNSSLVDNNIHQNVETVKINEEPSHFFAETMNHEIISR